MLALTVFFCLLGYILGARHEASCYLDEGALLIANR